MSDQDKRTEKDDMPPFVGVAVRVGTQFGRVRIGSFGPSPNAGKFEVELTGGEQVLVPWGEVSPMTWEEMKANPPVPPALVMYSPKFLD